MRTGHRTQLSVEAIDGSGKKSTSQASVDIVVVDKTPFKNIYKFDAREDVSPYSEIGKIDVPAGFQITISETSFHGYFSVNPTSGILRSEARLDRPNLPFPSSSYPCRKIFLPAPTQKCCTCARPRTPTRIRTEKFRTGYVRLTIQDSASIRSLPKFVS